MSDNVKDVKDQDPHKTRNGPFNPIYLFLWPEKNPGTEGNKDNHQFETKWADFPDPKLH